MISSFIFELTLSWKRPLLVSCGESPLLLLSHCSRHLQESVRKLHTQLHFCVIWKKSTGHLSMEIVNKQTSRARVLLREANCSSNSQEINRSLWKSKFRQRVHNSTPRILILSQVSLDHAPTPLLEHTFQYYPNSTHRSSKRYTTLRPLLPPPKPWRASFLSPIWAT